jgi:hypothetical protein
MNNFTTKAFCQTQYSYSLLFTCKHYYQPGYKKETKIKWLIPCKISYFLVIPEGTFWVESNTGNLL